jgi:aspartyl-tRNA(Asn)/glutamyl-tRNA(Gln) amidotransferase subunit C
MTTPIDATVVRRLADLASLALEEEEVVELTRDLSRIVEYVAILDEAETSEVDPLQERRSALRADEPRPSLSTELALREAPRITDGGFSVPGFVDEG